MAESKDPTNRDISGRFVIGNESKGGRKRLPETVRTMFEAATPASAKRLIEALDAERAIVVSDGQAAGSHIEYVADHDMRIKAAEKILDRLYGKPAQTVTDEDGTPLFASLGTELVEVLRKMNSAK